MASGRFRTAVHALALGYKITVEGVAISPTGLERKLRCNKDDNRRTYWHFTVQDPITKISRPVPVHILQAIQKFGADAVKSADLVRHLDGDSLNNHYDNIALGTHTDNYMDRTPESRREHALKAARVQRKLSDEDVARLRALHKTGRSGNSLAEEFGLSKSTVSYIVNKKTYT